MAETAAASIRARRVEPISSARPGIRMIIAADAHHSGTCLAVSAAAPRPPPRPCASRPTARSPPHVLRLSAGDALQVLGKSPQPGYVPHCNAAAAPVGGLADRQTLIDGHHSQRLSGTQLRVLDRLIAFTERDQHLNRQILKPTFPVGPYLAQYRMGVQRRPACWLPYRLLTHHLIPPRHGSVRG
jgi:hypothetical protein